MGGVPVFFGSVGLCLCQEAAVFSPAASVSSVVSGNVSHFLAVGCLLVFIRGDVVSSPVS